MDSPEWSRRPVGVMVAWPGVAQDPQDGRDGASTHLLPGSSRHPSGTLPLRSRAPHASRLGPPS